MAQEFSNNCLVCGEPQTGKTTVLSQLISNLKFNTNDNGIKTCQWETSNKYYTAQVNFIVINDINSLENVPNQNTQALLLFVNLNQSRAEYNFVSVVLLYVNVLLSYIAFQQKNHSYNK